MNYYFLEYTNDLILSARLIKEDFLHGYYSMSQMIIFEL